MEQEYRGIVIEEALDDNRLINGLFVEKLHITGHPNREDRWHMYQVLVSREQIDQLTAHVIDGWYIHFWKDRDVIACFSNKQFHFNYDRKETWKDVVDYGLSAGFEGKYLDFLIKGL